MDKLTVTRKEIRSEAGNSYCITTADKIIFGNVNDEGNKENKITIILR